MKYQNLTLENKSIEELSIIYAECNEAYYNTDSPLMSDEIYDKLEEHLHKNGYDTNILVGASVVGHKEKIKRDFKMYSLNKYQILDENMSSEHAKTLFDKYGVGLLSWKYDGLAIEIHYRNGKLVSVSTRGDGFIGLDVTKKVISRIPQIITTIHKNIFLRCEGVMKSKTFEEKYSEKYSNPRNLVSGIIMDENLNDERVQDIDFVIHEYLDENGIPLPSEVLKLDGKLGLKLKVSWPILSKNELMKHYDNAQIERPNYEYPTDGLVYVSNSYYGVKISANSKYPKHSTSIKFKPPRLISEITEITWELKRGGQYQPIIHYKPVYFDGRFMKKASGYNYKYIVFNDMCVGKKVEIVISNDLIPMVKAI